MKKILLIVVSLFLMVTFSYATDVEPQKFNSTITIKFKGKTLSQISEIESKIKEFLGDSESIVIEFDIMRPNLSYPYIIDTSPLDRNILNVPGPVTVPN